MVLLLMMNLHSLKEVLDNCIDEFVMGAGKTIEVTIRDKTVNVRDYGRGIPLGKVIDVVSNEYRWKIRPWLLRNQWV
jgi:DNA gyrase/topoisomerase IV subunit B